MGRDGLRASLATGPLAALLVLAAVSGPHVPPGAPQAWGPRAMPVQATAFLGRPTGRVFSTYRWADYLLGRDIPVFVGGRTQPY